MNDEADGPDGALELWRVSLWSRLTESGAILNVNSEVLNVT